MAVDQWWRSQASPLLMGIVNVTPDSFSDGGRFFSHDAAIRHGLALIGQGAAIIDVGGESSRPGASPISQDEEIERIIPVIEAVVKSGARVSVDTYKPQVMQAAARAGASLVNDIYALRQPGALEMAADLKIPVCLMHMQGTPENMQVNPSYDDVIGDIRRFLENRIDACLSAGIDSDRIFVDPGFGFGKTRAHNLALMKGIGAFSGLGAGLVVGLSRKAFVRNISGANEGAALDEASAMLGALAAERGARVLRVHEVKRTAEILNLWRQVSATR